MRSYSSSSASASSGSNATTRYGALVEYIAEYAPYLVMALLPEDAEALDEKYERIPADALAA